jgi:hypothetical protein
MYYLHSASPFVLQISLYFSIWGTFMHNTDTSVLRFNEI